MSWPVIIVVSLTSGLLGSLGMGAGAVLLLYLRVFGGAGQFEAQGINLIFFLPIAALSIVLHARNGLAVSYTHLDEIAKEAEFFSFGTNDLTQMTFGFSRDDAGKFLNYYYENKIYESDPFAHLDQKGVGKLVEMAVKLGRQTRPDIHLGICGEHGGDPTSVEFCHRVGLNYVSCSPFRVPIARLAAAQAAIKYPR